MKALDDLKKHLGTLELVLDNSRLDFSLRSWWMGRIRLILDSHNSQTPLVQAVIQDVKNHLAGMGGLADLNLVPEGFLKQDELTRLQMALVEKIGSAIDALKAEE